MQWTASFTTDSIRQALHHRQRQALVYPGRMRRGLPLTSVTDGAAVVERVTGAADLDGAMRAQLTRVLLITVRDWSHK